jgi:hypothetical protein
MPVLASLDPTGCSIAAIGKADGRAEFRRDGKHVGVVGVYVRGGAVRCEPIGLHFHLRFDPSRVSFRSFVKPTEVAFEVNRRSVRVYRIVSIDFTLGTAICALPKVRRETTPLTLPEVIDVTPELEPRLTASPKRLWGRGWDSWEDQ